MIRLAKKEDVAGGRCKSSFPKKPESNFSQSKILKNFVRNSSSFWINLVNLVVSFRCFVVFGVKLGALLPYSGRQQLWI